MKRFLLLFLPIFVLAFVVALSSASLKDIFASETKGRDFAYYASDLGFVLEDEAASNFVEYRKNNVVVGECVWLEDKGGMLSRVKDKLGLTITKKYYVGETLMIEGVSPMLKYFSPQGQNNVQIAVKEGEIVVGSPVIYGSY